MEGQVLIHDFSMSTSSAFIGRNYHASMIICLVIANVLQTSLRKQCPYLLVCIFLNYEQDHIGYYKLFAEVLDLKTSSEYVEVAIGGIFTLEITSLGFNCLVIVVDVEVDKQVFTVASIVSSTIMALL